jgi:dihydrofolate synthase/folylpolyglutamate synthase
MDIPLLSPEQARTFWYGLVNFEQRSPVAADLKLDRMRALLARLGDPQRRLRILHIAGSKGKGSTSAMLAAILGQAGYRTGLFTSPHLCRVEERFQIDGTSITEAELTTLLSEVHHAAQGRLPLTFFEVATAVGLLHFVRRRVDVAVLEVGLGGRLDSTNVCRPAAAVITSISFDHTQQLGNRLASIAWEKAGIVKPLRPTLSGATPPEVRAVIEGVCKERHSVLRQLGVDFHFTSEPGRVTATHMHRPRLKVRTWRRQWPWMEVNLLGEHQAANAALAVAVVEELNDQGWHVPQAAVAAGLRGVRWPARLEVFWGRPLVLLDCAHNVASARALVETLQASFPPSRRWLVFAGSSDKDLEGMFRVMAPYFYHALLTRFLDSPRAVAPLELAERVAACCPLSTSVYPTPAEALRAARASAGPDDLICITGSVFLAGQVRPLLDTAAQV